MSAPHIIAIDNEKAAFSVGNNIPYQAGLSFGGIGLPAAGATGGATAPVGSIGQNIQREDLTLELNVTPHISSNDAVRLEIEQNTKDLGGKDPVLGPTWTERKLKTQVVVHDQESVVIGGLVQDSDVVSVNKVPLLGDIPLLGYLFKYTTKTKKKTNLLILLTPYIIKDQLDLEQHPRKRKTREYREFAASFAILNDKKLRAQDRLPPQARPGRGNQPRDPVGRRGCRAAQRRRSSPARQRGRGRLRAVEHRGSPDDERTPATAKAATNSAPEPDKK